MLRAACAPSGHDWEFCFLYQLDQCRHKASKQNLRSQQFVSDTAYFLQPMQTTSITVVSEATRVPQLHKIAQFIERNCPYYCIDMTTRVENQPGTYVDCIIPKQGPHLVTKYPILPWRKGSYDLLVSRPFALIRMVLTILCVIGLAFVVVLKNYYDDETVILATFLSSIMLLSLLNFLEFSVYRGKVLLGVMKKFDFWYICGMNTMAMGSTGFLYYKMGIHLGAVIAGFVCFMITFDLTVVGIDGSHRSRQGRLTTMFGWFLIYAALFCLGGFATALLPDTVTKDYQFEFDLWVTKLTPQSAGIISIAILMFFFVRYSWNMFRGAEYVMLYFEVASAKQEIGRVDEADDIDPAHSVEISIGDISMMKSNREDDLVVTDASVERLSAQYPAEQLGTSTAEEEMEARKSGNVSWHANAAFNASSHSTAESQSPVRMKVKRGSVVHLNVSQKEGHRFTNQQLVDAAPKRLRTRRRAEDGNSLLSPDAGFGEEATSFTVGGSGHEDVAATSSHGGGAGRLRRRNPSNNAHQHPEPRDEGPLGPPDV